MNGCKIVATPLENKTLMKEDNTPKVENTIYQSLIRSMLYLTATRLDIICATSLHSRFLQSPSQIHQGTAKRILRHLEAIKNYDIWYESTVKSNLLGYTNSDWLGSLHDIKSTPGYAFTLCFGLFSWPSKSKKQSYNHRLKSNIL